MDELYEDFGACPACVAQAGEPCFGLDGKPQRGLLHVEREVTLPPEPVKPEAVIAVEAKLRPESSGALTTIGCLTLVVALVVFVVTWIVVSFLSAAAVLGGGIVAMTVLLKLDPSEDRARRHNKAVLAAAGPQVRAQMEEYKRDWRAWHEANAARNEPLRALGDADSIAAAAAAREAREARKAQRELERVRALEASDARDAERRDRALQAKIPVSQAAQKVPGGGLACPQCGGTQWKAGRKAGKVGASVAVGLLIAPVAGLGLTALASSKVVRCVTCGATFKRG